MKNRPRSRCNLAFLTAKQSSEFTEPRETSRYYCQEDTELVQTRDFPFKLGIWQKALHFQPEVLIKALKGFTKVISRTAFFSISQHFTIFRKNDSDKKVPTTSNNASYFERNNCLPKNIPTFEERGKENQLSLVPESKQISIHPLEQSIVLLFDKREITYRAVINCFSSEAVEFPYLI